MTLFETVGFTSKEFIYFVCFAFLTPEQEDKFTLVLKMYFDLLKSEYIVLKYIVLVC